MKVLAVRPCPLDQRGIVLAGAAWLLWIGREPWCKCGYVKLGTARR